MSRKNPKIEIATPDDVSKYTEGRPAESAPPTDSQTSAAEGATGGSSAGAASPLELEALRAEIEQWKDKCLRAKAEFANYQRRSSQERAEAVKYANAEFAKAFLHVADDLERALAHVETATADSDAIVSALKLIHDNLVKVFREHHVEPIDAAGMPFDPAYHHALMQRPSTEHPEPTVLEVLQKGYRLHERVLRPAQVIVSKPLENQASQDASSGADDSGAGTTE